MKKKLLVCNYFALAKAWVSNLGLGDEWDACGISSGMLTGRRYEEIVLIGDFYFPFSPYEQSASDRFLAEVLPTRLVPNGKIVRVLKESACVAIG